MVEHMLTLGKLPSTLSFLYYVLHFSVLNEFLKMETKITKVIMTTPLLNILQHCEGRHNNGRARRQEPGIGPLVDGCVSVHSP